MSGPAVGGKTVFRYFARHIVGVEDAGCGHAQVDPAEGVHGGLRGGVAVGLARDICAHVDRVTSGIGDLRDDVCAARVVGQANDRDGSALSGEAD